ncbi:MAG: hypothetical protein FWC34_00435, partial [Bacteroidetes bacterium]|nr:hypothetical protein [Bacteroidota bacterium]
AMKGVLNGFELRQGYLPSDLGEPIRPGVQTSFKDLVDNFNAIDNIGYGSEKGNDGRNYVRVERWQWFYNDEVLVEINAPAVDDHVLKGNFWSRLKTGYSRYIDESEFNAVDAFHTEREYTTGVPLESEKDVVCDLIACPYLIELTRRQQFDENQNNEQHTRNWRFDNSTFVLALQRATTTGAIIEVEQGVEDTDGTIISPETMTNVRISPGRNAIRWAERFFEINSRRDRLEFASGAGNTYAKGRMNNSPGFVFLEDSANGGEVVENGYVPRKPPLLMDEIMAFDYPIKRDEYKAIRRNPHGIIRVNGVDYYLKEFEICPVITQTGLGLGRFQVIRKA